MTIKDFASMQKMTVQGVYRRLSRNGIAVKTVLDSDGNLTDEGLSILSNFYAVDDEQLKKAAEYTEILENKSKAETVPLNKEQLIKAVDKLKAEILNLNLTVSTQESTIKAQSEEITFLREALEREQNLHSITLTMLPDMQKKLTEVSDSTSKTGRKGLFGWWNRKSM